MNASEILLIMLVLRVIIPVGLVLGIGESQRRRQLSRFDRMASHA